MRANKRNRQSPQVSEFDPRFVQRRDLRLSDEQLAFLMKNCGFPRPFVAGGRRIWLRSRLVAWWRADRGGMP
jgi:hypothetical protein